MADISTGNPTVFNVKIKVKIGFKTMSEELARLKTKLEIMERNLFKRDLELLILKNPEYSHIEFDSIDEDGIDMLSIVNRKLGWDGVKKWLNDMFGANPKLHLFSSSNPKPRMLSDVLKEF
ncbi:MAG: hypothetical protein ACKPH7_26035 [Planktothrix sp.]|uniref:hypothetical protein n=1 Tax=Planktothrix sp. TaxID=3088171 RepID=UPI0038D48F39